MFEKLRGFKVTMVVMALIALLTAVGGLVISRWDQQSAVRN
jgi:hypothetical protein